MSDRVPPGYYRDHFGELKRDRRCQGDRRDSRDAWSGGERRNMGRRKTDQVVLAREHEQMIEDALEDFAAQHQD